ncbi:MULTISPECIES: type I phosphomannose isomerase catalytic subunit [Reichenbachiella]|uniref:type I phosphomannose isomerase catalytic subunit n=1 Tax=Reichenbachiella TaxID=156993 RepID=UPI000E6C8D03|nr:MULTISPECIES: type I phosphomannose isomerase catalytic subunit [Reichenbachiella]MBU2912959.1 class I mannose-6-phosphate isomerase [Reichenbachiella agariperforans]RJE72831.1 mannose-6-phosphate isomerase [Reichenbachiella sp. MSK19-1]
MKLDYPIKFEPILKYRMWGGDKLVDVLNKQSDEKNLGESWELSDVPGDISVVANGDLKGKDLKELLTLYGADLVGQKNRERFGTDFPILIKYIDAKVPLSIQLHPNDALAKERHNSFGKTEMWYVMDAEPDADLIVGFNKEVTKEEYVQHVDNNTLEDILNVEKVKKGDSFFINTGKIHAIGAGCLIAEIQQTSDVTYRVFDWNRVDKDGKPRELHTELALDAIDFAKKDDFWLDYTKLENSSNEIASCPYFTTHYLPVKGETTQDYSATDSFVIYMCVDGEGTVTANAHSVAIKKGETILLPAAIDEVQLSSTGMELLEVTV